MFTQECGNVDATSRINQCCFAFGGADQDPISLTNVEERYFDCVGRWGFPLSGASEQQEQEAGVHNPNMKNVASWHNFADCCLACPRK